MSSSSNIEWTDASWNPTVGCSKVSEGCRNCYAMQMAQRVAAAGDWATGEGKARTEAQQAYGAVVVCEPDGRPLAQWNGQVRMIESRLVEPLGWKKPRRVFVDSMSDLFHEAVPFEFILKVFRVMEQCPQHTFQVLTKRPERAVEFLGGTSGAGLALPTPPLPNVWLGTSIEDQATADERIPHLLQCPAELRFISAEPLLENVTLLFDRDRRKIDWVIAGGESGPEARPCEIEWLRHIRIQCYAHATPLFIKQLGTRPFDAKMRANVPPEGSNGWPPGTRFRTDVDAMAIWQCSGHAKLRDAKGGDPSEWPEDLRVREFPR